jgi:signal transduction histidine kinase
MNSPPDHLPQAELEAVREGEATARAEREVLAERDRIARDLQDQVIHRVFSAELGLQGVLGLVGHTQAAARIRAVVDDLDATIRDLRTAIFSLHDQPQQATSVRIQLTDLILQADDDLGFTPAIRFQGPVDAAVPDHIAADLIAAARSTLDVIARDGRATSAQITLHATGDELVLRVQHDGGITTGIDGLRDQAKVHGVVMDVTSHADTGTLLVWRIPLPHGPESG